MVECCLCKSSKEDDLQYGEMLQNENMAVHTFCLYLSSNLAQNGEDDEGFLGFLEADIKKEVRRVSLLNCFYCRKPYANVGCCGKRCYHAFHFICGLENRAENQFCGSYQSYCHKHVRKLQHSKPDEKALCVICYDNLIGAGERFNHLTMIRAPCCHNGWFHKLCLQRFAKTSGYFFKCPLCNEAKVFRQKLLAKGIFIPNRDAAWELEPNAFAELLERPNECTAPVCLCKSGRTQSTRNNPIIFCSTCGSTAMHKSCIPNGGKRFHCADCTIALERDSSRESLNPHGYNNNENDEEIDVDVCNVSDREDIELIQGLLPANEPQSEDISDDEIKPTGNRSNRLISSDSNRSEKSQENRPTSRRSTTTSSSCDELPQTCFTPRRNRKPKSYRVKRDSVSTEEDLSKSSSSRGLRRDVEDYEVEIIQILTPSKKKQIIDEEDSSEDDIYSISSDEVRFRKSNSKRSMVLRSDDEDEVNTIVPNKQSKLHAKTDIDENANARRNPATERDSAVMELSSSEDSDDDPVECFAKMVEKQKNISCIAQRTRTKSVYAENPHEYIKPQSSISSTDDEKNVHHTKDRPKTIKFQEPLTQEKQQNNLDISCIAKRTRRKSIYHESSEGLMRDSKSLTPKKEKNVSASIKTQGRRMTVCSETAAEKNKKYKKQQNEKADGKKKSSAKLDVDDSKSTTNKKATDPSAAIRSRDRRNTVCSEATPKYNKQYSRHQNAKDDEIEILSNEDISETTSIYEYSQVYEKQYETDAENGEQDELQPSQSNNLEISCIANRTRKRKSNQMQNIVEVDESTSSSNSSTTSYKTALTDYIYNNYGRRNRQRILSNSSEDTENIYTDALSSTKSHKIDKWPKQNYDLAFHKTKSHLGNSSSYHPNNQHHPHIHNRKRV